MARTDGSPPTDDVADFAAELRTLQYPVTTGVVLATYGQRRIPGTDGSERFANVLRRVGEREFESPDELVSAIERERR